MASLTWRRRSGGCSVDSTASLAAGAKPMDPPVGWRLGGLAANAGLAAGVTPMGPPAIGIFRKPF